MHKHREAKIKIIQAAFNSSISQLLSASFLCFNRTLNKAFQMQFRNTHMITAPRIKLTKIKGRNEKHVLIP